MTNESDSLVRTKKKVSSPVWEFIEFRKRYSSLQDVLINITSFYYFFLLCLTNCQSPNTQRENNKVKDDFD